MRKTHLLVLLVKRTQYFLYNTEPLNHNLFNEIYTLFLIITLIFLNENYKTHDYFFYSVCAMAYISKVMHTINTFTF